MSLYHHNTTTGQVKPELEGHKQGFGVCGWRALRQSSSAWGACCAGRPHMASVSAFWNALRPTRKQEGCNFLQLKPYRATSCYDCKHTISVRRITGGTNTISRQRSKLAARQAPLHTAQYSQFENGQTRQKPSAICPAIWKTAGKIFLLTLRRWQLHRFSPPRDQCESSTLWTFRVYWDMISAAHQHWQLFADYRISRKGGGCFS